MRDWIRLAARVAALAAVAAWTAACDGDGTAPGGTGPSGGGAAQGAPPAVPAAPAPDEVVLPSGLRYRVIAEGGGRRRPRLGDTVRVHYTGTLADGSVFDSSRERGQPAEFALGPGLIAGWNEALALMSRGARWHITLPPALAYGAAGRPPKIPPAATLSFDIELLAIRPAPELPVFRAPDPAKQIATASGLRYEVLVEGAGAAPAADGSVELEFALWNREGRLLDCSAMQQGQRISGPIASLPLPFLREAAPLMRTGGTLLLEVPAELGFGKTAGGPNLPAGSTTIWTIRLARSGAPRPVPEFVMPAAEALRKTASGLAYEVVRAGEGDAPGPGARVVVDYAGWLADGTPFDSSYERGLDATFRCDQVIPGWSEGLRLMAPGAVYRFVIPPALGYGARGAGQKIPPNATLVFHVTLHRVLPDEDAEDAGETGADGVPEPSGGTPPR